MSDPFSLKTSLFIALKAAQKQASEFYVNALLRQNFNLTFGVTGFDYWVIRSKSA